VEVRVGSCSIIFYKGEKAMVWGNKISEEIAGRNAIYAMMASNCYHNPKKKYFPVEYLGWMLVDEDGDPSDEPTIEKANGFACDIYEHEHSNKTVIAYRGSDNKIDWILANLAAPISTTYFSAKKAARRYMEKHPERELTVVGHSLGGGLALSASVHFGLRALTFNTSPRIFDGLGDKHKPGIRVVIYQKGDPLCNARENLFADKLLSAVKPADIHMTTHEVSVGDEHNSDLMALGLAQFGRKANPELDRILESI